MPEKRSGVRRPARPTEVRIWCLDVIAAVPALAELEAELPRLSPAECARGSAIQDMAQAQKWLAAHIALRLLLERTLGPSVRRVPFVISNVGKPSLADRSLEFSLAHSFRYALFACSELGPVGVDIEETRQPRVADERRAAIIDHAKRLSSQPLTGESNAAFLQAWVRLEALAKGTGRSLASVLQQAGAFGPKRRERPAAGAGAALPADVVVSDLALGPGRYGAIAMPPASTGAWVGEMPTDRDALKAFVLGS